MVEHWICDQKCHGFESQQEWQENYFLQGQLSVLTLILVCICLTPPCYCSSTRDLDHSAKHAGGRLHLKTGAHCKLVHACMVYTECVLRWQQFHAMLLLIAFM